MEPDPSVSMMRQLVETHRSDLSALRRLYTVSFSCALPLASRHCAASLLPRLACAAQGPAAAPVWRMASSAQQQQRARRYTCQNTALTVSPPDSLTGIRPSRTARFTQLFDDAEEQLLGAVEFEALDSPGRIDWHLFRERGP